MRNRRRIKPRDPDADAAYYEEFKKIEKHAREKMKIFDELPPVVRHAMTQEPMGSISAKDVRRYVGAIPDDTLARAVIENGKVAYQQFMEKVREDEDERARQRALRFAQYDTPPPVRVKKKVRAKKPRTKDGAK